MVNTLPHVDAEGLNHLRVLDAGADDHPETGSLDDEVDPNQDNDADEDDEHLVVEANPRVEDLDRRTPGEETAEALSRASFPGPVECCGFRHRECRSAPHRPNDLDDDEPQPERHHQLVQQTVVQRSDEDDLNERAESEPEHDRDAEREEEPRRRTQRIPPLGERIINGVDHQSKNRDSRPR